jgi:hypothetical protein
MFVQAAEMQDYKKNQVQYGEKNQKGVEVQNRKIECLCEGNKQGCSVHCMHGRLSWWSGSQGFLCFLNFYSTYDLLLAFLMMKMETSPVL